MPTWIEVYLSDANPFFYPAVFVSLVLAGLCFPISADLVLLTVGFLAYQGHADSVVLIPLCISGILLGDITMFFIAKNLGSRLLGVWPFRKVITQERLSRAEVSFQQHGYRMVFLARFMPGVRTVFMFTSGLLRLRFWKFILHDFSGAAIVIPCMILSVKWAAGNKDAILALVSKGQWVVLAIIAVAVSYYFFRSRAQSKASSEK